MCISHNAYTNQFVNPIKNPHDKMLNFSKNSLRKFEKSNILEDVLGSDCQTKSACL